MNYFKADNRKSNAVLFLGVTFLVLTYFTFNTESIATKVVCTTFLIIAALTFISLALIPRYKVSINKNELIIKSRLGLFSKRIPFSDIKQVKVLDKEYPITAYRNTILHLLLWDKKFNRFKQIQLYDMYGSKIFTIDGQAIDNNDFSRLVKSLKVKAAHNRVLSGVGPKNKG